MSELYADAPCQQAFARASSVATAASAASRFPFVLYCSLGASRLVASTCEGAFATTSLRPFPGPTLSEEASTCERALRRHPVPASPGPAVEDGLLCTTASRTLVEQVPRCEVDGCTLDAALELRGLISNCLFIFFGLPKIPLCWIDPRRQHRKSVTAAYPGHTSRLRFRRQMGKLAHNSTHSKCVLSISRKRCNQQRRD